MFFYELGLNSILCLFPVLFYQFFIGKMKDRRYKDLAFSLCLFFITALLLIYGIGDIKYLFIEVPLFIGIIKEKKLYSTVLAILMGVFLLIDTNIHPIFIVSSFFIYILSSFAYKDSSDNLLRSLSIEKAFFTSLICFSYYSDFYLITFLYLLASIVYFYFFLNQILRLISSLSNDISLNMIESEKRIFKITHEIKNPIAVCKGYLDMLDTNDKDKVKKYIPIIKGEISRTLTIMDDFLSLGKIAIQKDILDVCLLIEDVTDTMRQLLDSRKVELIIPNFDSEYYIYGDYDRLKQVLINLIKNASEASATRIEVLLEEDNKGIYIKIVDNGEGISKRELKRVGEVFFTTKSKGTGIGVNLSKEIIRLHQGKINYSSVVGEGTLVNIFLPTEKRIN